MSAVRPALAASLSGERRRPPGLSPPPRTGAALDGCSSAADPCSPADVPARPPSPHTPSPAGRPPRTCPPLVSWACTSSAPMPGVPLWPADQRRFTRRDRTIPTDVPARLPTPRAPQPSRRPPRTCLPSAPPPTSSGPTAGMPLRPAGRRRAARRGSVTPRGRAALPRPADGTRERAPPSRPHRALSGAGPAETHDARTRSPPAPRGKRRGRRRGDG